MEKVGLENGRAGNPVPCPRCQSFNTKFCYYNNHNVNQPRHFCRDCQRYWTAGGSLRNVPIGAGKRKHKGPHAAPSKPENLPSIFSFHPDQGVYTPSLEHPNVLSFQQPAAHGYGESKPVEVSCPVPQAPSVIESQPHVMPAFVSRPQASACHDAANAVRQTSAFACSLGSEKGGITAFSKQPSLSLGLNLSKESSLQEGDSKNLSHIHKQPLDPSSQQSTRKQDSRPVHCNTERDESTGCSSVTANLGPSVLEAVEVSTNPTMIASTMPGVEQIASFLNPMMALGASMCPPWVWPFIMSGRNAVPPAGLPQVDPTLAAATMGAMASVPPINPAFAAAAMGAMASGGRFPQIDPNVMAAMTASLLQFPQMWSPYMWGLPWSTPWSTTSSAVNASNGVNKRPASPSPEQGGASKSSKKEHLEEAFHSTGMRAAEIVNGPNFLCPAMYFDAFRPKPDASPVKPAVPWQLDERLDTHQQQASPHSNPAAQARSAAFQEGN